MFYLIKIIVKSFNQLCVLNFLLFNTGSNANVENFNIYASIFLVFC